MFGRLFSFIVNAFVLGGMASLAIPGTHRVVFPEIAGLVEIAPRIWTDAPERAVELFELTETARARVGVYFGGDAPNPTVVLCSTSTCAAAFGVGGNGLSIMDLVVMAGPGGLTLGTLTHEMTHSRLHRKMGLRNIVRQPFPTWFDEGLATHVANHPRVIARVTPEAQARVREVRRFWQLNDAFRALGVGLTYAAAAEEVAAIERRIGRAGLLELIERAEAGERFDAVLRELTSR